MAQFTNKKLRAQDNSKAKAKKKAAKVEYKKNNPGLFRSIPEQQQQYSLLTPQQQQLQSIIQALAGQSLPNLNLPGNQQYSFAPQKAEYMRQFDQEFIPSIAQRFQNMTNGAGTSPDLYRQLGQGAAQYKSMLDALESQYGLQQQGLQSNNLANLLNAGLGQQFDYSIIQPQDSLFKRGIKAALPSAFNRLGSLFSNTFSNNQPQNNQSNYIQPRNNPIMQNYNQNLTPQQSPLGFYDIQNSILNGYKNAAGL